MTWHLVLLKPRADLTAQDQAALVDALERAVREIPSVRDVRIGRRLRHGAGYEAGMPDVAEFMVALAFDDRAGLQSYLQHPAHADLGARFNQSVSAALVYDFEGGGVEVLRAAGFVQP